MPIEPFDARTGEPVFAFLDRVVAPRGRRHWEWKYRLLLDTNPSAFYWIEPDGRLLGFIGMMRTTLFAGEHRFPAAWFVDWHVLPGDRGVGVGLALLRKAEQSAKLLLTLQGSADTRHILPRLGWRQSRSPTTWVRPLSARFLAAAAARQMPEWLRGLRHIARVGTGYFHLAEPAALHGAALIDVERLPSDYDAVWEQRAPEFAPLMRRDSDYLNFLCADYPEGGYRLQLVQWQQQTVGHLVSRLDTDRHGFRRGRIVDLLWPRAHTSVGTWLLHTTCWQLQTAGADYLECVVSDPELRDGLQRRKFRQRAAVPLWYHHTPSGMATPERWHVSFLDCDRAYR